MLKLEKYTENDYPLYTRLMFNEQAMHMNPGRVFTEEEADLFFRMESPDLGFYKVFFNKEYIGM